MCIEENERKIRHFFDEKHQLQEFGFSDIQSTMDKVVKEVIKADQLGLIPVEKPFVINTFIGGFEFEIRGVVLDNELKFGTFFIPKK